MIIEELIDALKNFTPFPDSDLVNDNATYLSKLMSVWQELEDKRKAIPAIFSLLEKYPTTDLGSPSPLIHAIESLNVKFYSGPLQSSLIRRPTPLTAWMYNRMINLETSPTIIGAHIERLKLFGKHPFADVETKEIIKGFIEHQSQRLQTI